MILRVRAALLATPIIDHSKLIADLNDLPIEEAREKLGQRVDLAEPPKIKITPSWWGRMPFFGFRMVLFVKTPQ